MFDRWVISKEVQFDAGHRVPNHASKCRNPHGHRYRVVAYVSGQLIESEGASDEGMVQDFSEIKEILTKYVHDKFDHGFIVADVDDTLQNCLLWAGEADESWKIIIFPMIPTAENLAAWIYREVDKHLSDKVYLEYVEVWETPTSMARYPCK